MFGTKAKTCERQNWRGGRTSSCRQFSTMLRTQNFIWVEARIYQFCESVANLLPSRDWENSLPLGPITLRSRAGILIQIVLFKVKMYSHSPGSTGQELCALQCSSCNLFVFKLRSRPSPGWIKRSLLPPAAQCSNPSPVRVTYQEVRHFLQHVGPVQPKCLFSPRTDEIDTGLLGLKRQIVVIPVKTS